MLMTLALLYQVAQHRDLFSRNKAPCQRMGGHPTLKRPRHTVARTLLSTAVRRHREGTSVQAGPSRYYLVALNRSVPQVAHTDTVVATEIHSQRMQKALPDASKMVGDCAGWLAGERASMGDVTGQREISHSHSPCKDQVLPIIWYFCP